MPLYRFACESCGQITKISRRMTEEKTSKRYTHCGDIKLIRVFLPVGLSVKETSSREGSACCGKDEPYNTPPCSDSGVSQKY